MDEAFSPTPPSELRIDVGILRRRGISRQHIEGDLPAAWLASVLADTDARVESPGCVVLDLQVPMESTVVVSGSLTTRFEVPCGRCLEPAQIDHKSAFQATFVVRDPALSVADPWGDPADDEGGVGLAPLDLDTWTFDGRTVDLSVVVAEQVKLAYPMRALCARGEACRGLCSGCGADLNAGAGNGRCSACGAAGAASEPGADESALAAALRKVRLPD